mgnify:CR=1 FL=1|jgi:dolichol-phosphate mannosyltransferase/undecaprenyl-phosphate 4-deoxy-4-formamido-L-arabinose transferase
MINIEMAVMKNKIEYSIVIPVYNSSASLIDLSRRLHIVFADIMNESYEIIFVDDCSQRQETWKTLQSIARDYKTVRAFRLARNFGQASAVLCGLAHARGRWIVTMDDDLQHRPEDIPLLAEKREHDVVIARFSEKNCSYGKKLSSQIKGILDVYLLGKPKNIMASPFRILKKSVVESILSIQTPRPFPIAQILQVTSDLVNVDVDHQPRKYDTTNYNLKSSLSLLSNMLFNNSSFMLRAMSVTGFLIAVFSFFYGVYLIIRWYLINNSVPGWTSLMVVLLGATGIIVFCLGILGEYVSRLISTAERRPVYIVKDSIDAFEENNDSC